MIGQYSSKSSLSPETGTPSQQNGTFFLILSVATIFQGTKVKVTGVGSSRSWAAVRPAKAHPWSWTWFHHHKLVTCMYLLDALSYLFPSVDCAS